MYLGTFVQRTLNSGQSSATTSLTDSFKSLCVWRTASDNTLPWWVEEEAGDGRRGPDAGAAGAAAADAASGAARALGAAAGASETCLLPCHILCFCCTVCKEDEILILLLRIILLKHWNLLWVWLSEIIFTKIPDNGGGDQEEDCSPWEHVS